MFSSSNSQHESPQITVLYDNRKHNPALMEGFGFSCFVEWHNKKILFDTGGKSSVFLDNANKQHIPFDQITSVVFSHHHWDHTSGIDELLKRISFQTKIYLPGACSSLQKRISKDFQVKMVKHLEKIDDEIYLLVLKGSYFFCSIYELALLLNTPKGVVIITGCAHPGIVKIVQEAQATLGPVQMVLGGFHLCHKTEGASAKVVKQLKELSVGQIAPCHCVGDLAIAQFKKEFGKNFIQVGTGSIIKV